jgi:hypothetical protein
MNPKIKAAINAQLIGAIIFMIGGVMLVGPAAILLVVGGLVFGMATQDYVTLKRAEPDEAAE